jgi:hypothetical protein
MQSSSSLIVIVNCFTYHIILLHCLCLLLFSCCCSPALHREQRPGVLFSFSLAILTMHIPGLAVLPLAAHAWAQVQSVAYLPNSAATLHKA